MKTLTLFWAYRTATARRESALERRCGPLSPGRFGIAVAKDYAALDFQKYDRLATKLAMRIQCHLGAPLPEAQISAIDYMYLTKYNSGRSVKYFDAWLPRVEQS